jgi:hypothetical protein
MSYADPGWALALTDRARFVLTHCGQPMRFRGSIAAGCGQAGQESVATSARYTCDVCTSTLELHLTERKEAE